MSASLLSLLFLFPSFSRFGLSPFSQAQPPCRCMLNGGSRWTPNRVSLVLIFCLPTLPLRFLHAPHFAHGCAAGWASAWTPGTAAVCTGRERGGSGPSPEVIAGRVFDVWSLRWWPGCRTNIPEGEDNTTQRFEAMLWRGLVILINTGF